MEYYYNFEETDYLYYTFKIFCTLSLVSCDSKCNECNQLSESKEKMNCNGCISPYDFSVYSTSDLNKGNCCNNIPNCQTYNLNCDCFECVTNYILINNNCVAIIQINNLTISAFKNEEKTIELHSLTTNQKIQIQKNGNFYGDISISNSGSAMIVSTQIEFDVTCEQIIYKSDKVGEYSFNYSIYQNNVLISNIATITIQVCKSGCTCGINSTSNQYECF